MDPATIAITVGSLISGFIGAGESPQEAKIKELLDRLEGEMGFFKETPFSKEELFNTIMPAIQKTYRGAANVAAGQIGSTIPETSGAPQGQAFMDYYTQALAPVIAKGEEAAGNTYQNFVDLWAKMDSDTKARVLGAYQLMLGGAQGLPQMNDTQKFLTSALKGADIGSTITGNINMANAISDQAEGVKDIQKYLLSGNQDLEKIYKDIFKQTQQFTPAFP